MNKFIKKTSLFLLPITLLVSLTFYSYGPNSNDLLRLAYLPEIYTHYHSKKEFLEITPPAFAYDKIMDKPIKRKYKVMSMGDSFSEFIESYNNIIAQHYDLLHFDKNITGWNSLNQLYALSLGDFFIEFNIDYVIYQGVERHIYGRTKYFDSCLKKVDVKDVFQLVNKSLPQANKNPNKKLSLENYIHKKLFTKESFVLLKNTYHYLNNKTYLFENQVYKVELNQKGLFSIPQDNLLFYYEDLIDLEEKNEKKVAVDYIQILNTISKNLKNKGVQLLVLTSADKYSMYYEYMVNPPDIEPKLLEHLLEIPKEFIYIDSREIHKKHELPDLYYYDDTHWSPIGQQIVADKILELINISENTAP